MHTLANFDHRGLLPAGDHAPTLEELRQSFLVKGPTGRRYRHWNQRWRAHLVENLSTLVEQLWETGIERIFIDGSFVEDKLHPNDIDGYFDCPARTLADGSLVRRLNAMDPLASWGWDNDRRRPYRGYPKLQLPMWHAYRVELYPHVGQPSGIRDEHGHELEFPAAFRISRRDRRPRGIVQIRKR